MPPTPHGENRLLTPPLLPTAPPTAPVLPANSPPDIHLPPPPPQLLTEPPGGRRRCRSHREPIEGLRGRHGDALFAERVDGGRPRQFPQHGHGRLRFLSIDFVPLRKSQRGFCL